HCPLLTLRKLDVTHDPTGRRGRWALELDPYQWTDPVVPEETVPPTQENHSSPVMLETPTVPKLHTLPVQPSSVASTSAQ
ncbi:hypothetical protein L3Q82_008539, partial [Scortum barcoo]